MIRCAICRSRKRKKIELELLAGYDSQKTIARRHKVPFASIGRHKAHHIEPDMVIEEIARLRRQDRPPEPLTINPLSALLDLRRKIVGEND